MFTKEKIAAINQTIATVNIKGKDYAMVAARVKGFRDVCPEGTIDTNIVDLDDDRVVVQAKVYDENDHLLASGSAEERRDASTINKTSYVENCETSAVGRALGMLGIGSEAHMASADEMTLALMNQNELMAGKKALRLYCDEHALTLKDVWEEHGLNKEAKNSAFYSALAELMKKNNE